MKGVFPGSFRHVLLAELTKQSSGVQHWVPPHPLSGAVHRDVLLGAGAAAVGGDGGTPAY